MTPPLRSGEIAKIAVGPKKLKDARFDRWERILAEIIVGDSFGVDRMDYLLRDSLHVGVVYGKFDQYRLIDTLRILPENEDAYAESVLGIEAGGLTLRLVCSWRGTSCIRRCIFTQFAEPTIFTYRTSWLRCWAKRVCRRIPVNSLNLTDNEVLVELRKAADDSSHPGNDPAVRIVKRKHFKVLYERNPNDSEKNPECGASVYNAACKKFGKDVVRHDRYTQKGGGVVFPVRNRDGRIVSSFAASDVLQKVPLVNIDYVLIAPEKLAEAHTWLKEEREKIIAAPKGEEE